MPDNTNGLAMSFSYTMNLKQRQYSKENLKILEEYENPEPRG